MKVSFDSPLVNLNGEPVLGENDKPAFIGRFLANALMNHTKGDSIKFYDWAKQMYKGGVVDFDRADQDTIKKFIKDSEQLTHLMKAQMLELFEKNSEPKSTNE